ncbi:hypothetical protein Moror_5608 [Moniliophthora roreri MCA 2997]|uniref:Uncharacterized protein n=1 Tax=Moniliophthora roreri (strain MCA 2997) TaxID=1381753 RepID=V2WMS2_MONRO|nr:hypothetical protein Moror_5608 [Moniliophthora roreri MCA 2997]
MSTFRPLVPTNIGELADGAHIAKLDTLHSPIPVFLSFQYANAKNGVGNGPARRYNNITATTNGHLSYLPAGFFLGAIKAATWGFSASLALDSDEDGR